MFATRDGVPDMNGSVEEEKCASGENSGPGTLWLEGEPQKREGRDEKGAANVTDEMGVGRT